MKYGLSDNQIQQIINVFKKFPELEEVILYGSRAMGSFNIGSDIDITLIGEKINLKIQNHIANLLDDLLLPYMFDLSIFHQISNQDLIKHIKKVGIIIYKR